MILSAARSVLATTQCYGIGPDPAVAFPATIGALQPISGLGSSRVERTPRAMTGVSKRARAVTRHWLIQASKSLSLGGEYLAGWYRAILWLPVLPWVYFLRKLLRKTADQRPGRGLQQTAPRTLVTRYINLQHRKDRNLEVKLALSGVGLETVKRFDAFQHSVGALGCALSHVSVLESLDRSGVPVALVCEDDIEFVADAGQLAVVLEDFMNRPELDVLCLSYRLRGPAFLLGKHLALANNLQTTAGYVAKRSAYKPLIKSFQESAQLLESGAPIEKASIDVRWKALQYSGLLFCIPRMPIARQRASHSDIVGKVKFYG